MSEQNKIPTSKVARASQVFRTSMRVGANYIKHSAQKAIHKEVSEDALNDKNAEELFKLMSQLKGSALKIAQLISMDNGLLPKQFTEKFAKAQNSAMALSTPLVMNTFKKYVGKNPNELYDTFNLNAVHAASIGQVHEATKDGKKLAVKMQYPGVADSIHSDLNMVKPMFLRFIGIKEKDVKNYFDEFEERLVEECDYDLELKNATMIANYTKHIPNLIIPTYYKELSGKKILTMDWIDGISLSTYIETEKDQQKKNQLAQTLADFLFWQIHEHQCFHADPHPGNFLVTDKNELVVLDFGCVKCIPKDFYTNYFLLSKPEVRNDQKQFIQILKNLDILREGDSEDEYKLFYETALNAVELVSYPVQSETFYFGDKSYNQKLQTQGESIFNNKEFRKPNAIRGSRHAIYLHRAFFGVFSILHRLNATVKMDNSFMDKLEL
ncbi:MAG: AarF/ABC1/UbiB kinase family protein [Chitinophagales bacterium]